MTTEKVNRLHIFYNAEHKPYMYGVVHIVDGSVENQWWEHPFIVSKRKSDGEEIVYGTVKRNLSKIQSQLDRIERFHSESKAKLEAESIALPVPGNPILPESELADRILDEQDDLLEDVLLAVSANIRILSEIFPSKLKKRKVTVYDYDDGEVGKIELSRIADLLLHNRYLVVRGHQVVDLISDERFMSAKTQMGLKINFAEYLSEVEKVVTGLTVKDLIGKLRSITKVLSTSSSMNDIVFLTQNLYTLGDSVVGGAASVNAGPLKTILDRVAQQHAERMYPMGSTAEKVEIVTTVAFTTPRFYLEPDLGQKQIRTAVQVNGSPKTLVMGYEEFFLEIAKSSGSRRLYTKPDR